ncbi:MAG: glycosyltransferase family 117 protein, partial [Anaerolineae bacterium]
MAEVLRRPAAVSEERGHPWPEAAAVLGLGLYLARVSAESLPGVRTVPQLVFLVLLGLVTSWFVKSGLDRVRVRHDEFGLLLIYVAWPAFSLAVAGAVGMLTLGSWLWRLRPLSLPPLAIGPWLPEVGVGIAAVILYGSTVAPSVLPADAGEFQLVGSTLGVAHPPGYALYTLLARLATLFPVGDLAGRVNALSIVFAVLTLVLLARLVREANAPHDSSRGVYWSAVLGAAALAGSPTFWVQATTANIRSLTGLFTAALLWLSMRYVQVRSRRRLATLAFVFGLGVGHHSSLVLLALPLLLYLALSDSQLVRQPARWLPAAGAFLLSLLVLLYLPLRSAMSPAFDPVPVNSLARFVDHVLALGFRGDLFYIASWSDFFERVLVYAQILGLQFGTWLPWAMLLALAGLLARDWRLGLLLGGVWAINALSAITYRAPQTVEYLIPSYVAMAATLGCGLRIFVAWMPTRRRTGLVLSMISVLLVRQVMTPLPDMRAQHTDTSTRTAAERLLRQAPQDAVILSNWHSATPLWYLQTVESRRPDLDVVYVYPEGDADNAQTWLKRINAAVVTRPVVVTNRFYAYESSGLVLEPLGDAWLVRLRPSDAPPDSATRVATTLGDRIRIEAVSTPDRGRPGDALHVDLYWRPTV